MGGGAYSVVMAVLAATGIVSGIYFLISWTVFHHKWGRYERRKWSLSRVDALLWVAVLTGLLLVRVERAVFHGGWYVLPDPHHQFTVTVLTGGASVALLFRAVWWRRELVEAKARLRKVQGGG